MESTSPSSFLARNDFLIRRLHSLCGLIPVGAYMVVHLLVNASILDSPGTFQNNVNKIHYNLQSALFIVEWLFIFLPILFHGIFGVVIIAGGLPNSSTYRYTNNVRYTLQRATGMIAFVFILVHVGHLHGWFHFEAWHNFIKSIGGARFRAFNAASTLGEAMNGFVMPLFYAIGVLSCVFHLANGIWTMGITWGVWVTPAAQARANKLCAGFGVVLALVGLSALVGAIRVDETEARKQEDKIYNASVAAGAIPESPGKRAEAVGEGDIDAAHAHEVDANEVDATDKPTKAN